MEEEEKKVTVTFNPESLEDLDKVKKFYGIERTSDMVRFLVKEKSREISNI